MNNDFSSPKSVPQPEITELNAAELTTLDHRHVWHPFTPMSAWFSKKDPLIITHGQDEYLYDIQGRRYIDGVSSLWCNIHGHRVPELDAAMQRQLSKVAHTTLLGACNVPSIQLAAELAQVAPAGLEKVFYSDNGSTAVEVALKMAFQYWQNIGRSEKTGFLSMTAAYHGDTLGAVSLGHIDAFHARYRAINFPSLRADLPQIPAYSPANSTIDSHIVPFSLFSEWDNYIRDVIAAHANVLAAVVIEPVVQGAGGMLMQPHGTLSRLRKLCDEHEVLLICDEVMTGFGRTGALFACDHEQISPDILCLSKGLTGGYMPLGATLTHQRIFDAFCGDPNAGRTFFHGHTFTGHPLACEVARVSLQMILERDLSRRALEMSQWLADGLRALRDHPNVGDIRITGGIAAVEIVQQRTPLTPFPWQRRMGGEICRRLRSHGVLLRPLGDVVVIMPPLAATKASVEQICDSLQSIMRQFPDLFTDHG